VQRKVTLARCALAKRYIGAVYQSHNATGNAISAAAKNKSVIIVTISSFPRSAVAARRVAHPAHVRGAEFIRERGYAIGATPGKHYLSW